MSIIFEQSKKKILKFKSNFYFQAAGICCKKQSYYWQISSSLQYIGSNCYLGLISYSSEVTVNVPIAQFNEAQARKINGELYNLKVSGGTHMYEAIAVGMKFIKDGLELHPNARVRIDADRVELRKLAAINEATFTSVQTEDVVETFKNLFAENF